MARESAVWVSPVVDITESVESVIVGTLHTIVRFKREVPRRVRCSIAYSNVLESES